MVGAASFVAAAHLDVLVSLENPQRHDHLDRCGRLDHHLCLYLRPLRRRPLLYHHVGRPCRLGHCVGHHLLHLSYLRDRRLLFHGIHVHGPSSHLVRHASFRVGHGCGLRLVRQHRRYLRNGPVSQVACTCPNLRLRRRYISNRHQCKWRGLEVIARDNYPN